MSKGSTGTSMQGTIEYTRGKKIPQKAYDNKPDLACCKSCLYYMDMICSFDGTREPNKAAENCENYTPPKKKNKHNKGYKKWAKKKGIKI